MVCLYPTSIVSCFDSGAAWLCKASMMEIYLEELKDLLKPGACKLKLRESIFAGVWVEGLHQAFVPSAQAAMQVRCQWVNGFGFLQFEQRLAALLDANFDANSHASRLTLVCVPAGGEGSEPADFCMYRDE